MVAAVRQEFTALAVYLMYNNSVFFDNGFETARRNDKGVVMLYDGKKGQYVGISDQKGNFFYLRFRDGEDFRYSALPNNGYKRTRISVNLRLVVVARNMDAFKVEEKLRSDLLSYTINQSTIELESAVLDSYKVFEAETGKEKAFSDKMDFLSIDFTLHYPATEQPCIEPLTK
jgi:hypothetical protein